MKFSPWVVAAFVSSGKNDQFKTSSSKQVGSVLNLFPGLPNVPVVDNNEQAIENLVVLENKLDGLISQQRQVTPLNEGISAWIQENVLIPPANAAETAAPPSKAEIKLLREAFAAFYGAERDSVLAEKLLSEAIDAWKRQPPDEQAGLYRVRGDVFMALLRPEDAIRDYTESIKLLESPGGDMADPAELPSSYLGRARAIRSLHVNADKSQASLAVKDYQISMRLNSREEWDTNEELEEDGMRRNPYAAWEWGMAIRLNSDYKEAAKVHEMAADFFDDIGDRPHSVISALDAGIDLAAAATSSGDSNDIKKATSVLKSAIDRTTTVEGRDIKLLQRVITKEGEGRMALSSLLWTSGNRQDAESQRGEACQRMDQLEADATRRGFKAPPKDQPLDRLLFNIDDGVGPFDAECARYKNADYVTNKLEWPSSLRQALDKLNNLK